MRQQIRKPINNQDLYDGCAEAFRRGWRKVKLYFMCGLPGERPADLDGIVDMAETIARIGKDVTGRYADVTASVSNFIPKPHTAYQWNGLQSRDYLHWAHRYLKSKVRVRSVTVKCHDIERSMLEGILTRGDRQGRRRARSRLASRRPARCLGRVFQSRGSGGRRLPIWASTFPSTATANGRSMRCFPGTIFTSASAASSWSRNNRARLHSSRKWPGRCRSSREHASCCPILKSGGPRSLEFQMATANQDQADDRRGVHGRGSGRRYLRAGSRGGVRIATVRCRNMDESAETPSLCSRLTDAGQNQGYALSNDSAV